MAVVEFRCEKCGKLLKAEARPGQRLRCPHCRRRIAVPQALASLPRPHVPPDAAGQAEEPQAACDEGGPLAAMAGLMPWVLSALLHAGLFLIMIFLVMISTAGTKEARAVRIFQALPDRGERMGGMRDPVTDRYSRGTQDRRTVPRRSSQRGGKIDPGETQKKINLLASDAEGTRRGADAELGLTAHDAPGGPRFYGEGDPDPRPQGVRNIVYVVDRSGSMAMTFDQVRAEMLRSIGGLKAIHDFHIILFSDGRVIEGPKRWLVPADAEHKLAAEQFLRDKKASGDTTALVAIQRAFEVLKHARQPGKLIYLLTDGDFAGLTGGSAYRRPDGRVLNGNEAVVQWLRDNNANHDVLINTLLLHGTDQTARGVLETIARENGGRFKQISPDE
jgi:DNA-directed RNA polymerase subunit RPC12/RpoP